jgi:sigma-B regulation protein RsbU (phosphoserine phosphatase)
LGIDPQEAFPDTRVTLDPGDVLLAYTDGLSEARSPGRDMWGTGGLDAALLGCSCDPPVLLDNLVDALDAHTHAAPADDDRTVVAIKFGRADDDASPS